jgi:hypothetical protein
VLVATDVAARGLDMVVDLGMYTNIYHNQTHISMYECAASVSVAHAANELGHCMCIYMLVRQSV